MTQDAIAEEELEVRVSETRVYGDSLEMIIGVTLDRFYWTTLVVSSDSSAFGLRR